MMPEGRHKCFTPHFFSTPWLLAIRPKTLWAAVGPVLVGSAMAYSLGAFEPLPALACLSVALLLQVGVNLSNDYFDFAKGIDTEERLGPTRVTQAGLIAPSRVKAAMIGAMLLALVPGTYLIIRGGWWLGIIAGASIIAGLAYSGGPYPLASHGLGDICVFLFFGPVAVCGTYYVQTLTLSDAVVWISMALGLLITAILVVNNLRDINTDRNSGKTTLAVVLGVKGTLIEYHLLIIGAYIIPVILVILDQISPWCLLMLLSAPLAFKLCLSIVRNPEGPGLNHLLSQTARLTLIYSLLLSFGFIL